jgi:hypothetical protein
MINRIITYIVFSALLGVALYVIILQQRNATRRLENASERVESLKDNVKSLEKLSDSLLERSFVLEMDMEIAEAKADSLGRIAGGSDLPCEHELVLREAEVRYVRTALDKCKESKALVVKSFGLQELVIENEVKICTELRHIDVSEHKKAKKRAFMAGAGIGSGATLLLLLLLL